MKLRTIRLLIICLLLNISIQNHLKAQIQQDSIEIPTWSEKKSSFKKSLYLTIPLVTAGIIAKTDNNLFSNAIFTDARNKRFPTFQSNLDDFLAIAPIGAVFTIDAFKESKNGVGDQIALLLKSELIMSAIVFPMKSLSQETRPDGSNNQSFPSGHTAQAFVAATFMHKEFGHRNVWYSIGAYTAASTVGIYRVLNNKHFVNDVLVGAGIGVLSTNLAYLTHQYKFSKKKNKNISFTPTYQSGLPGIYLAIKL